MRYDIEFMLPVSAAHPRYKARIDDLKKFGFINIKNYNILITLLVGNEKIPNIDQGWPEGCHINVVPSSKTHPAAKVYDFLAKITPEYVKKSNWFAKIDDDTINDVSGLIEGLNEQYDVDFPFYLVTKIMTDVHKVEFDLLNKLGYKKWWEQGGATLQHEHEGCVFSKKAMELMTQNPKCLELFEERGKINEGYTDQCMGAAARILKIYPIKSPMLSSLNDHFCNFGLFDGPIKHYHPLCHDKTPSLINIIKKIWLNKNDLLFKKLKNREYFLVFVHPNGATEFTHVYLHDNNSLFKTAFKETLTKDHFINEPFWTVENNRLQIFGNTGEMVAEFDCSKYDLENETPPNIFESSVGLLNDTIRYLIYSKL